MDVGFGLCPDKCYSKLLRAKFVLRNSILPTGHPIYSSVSLPRGVGTLKWRYVHAEVFVRNVLF